MKFGSYQEVEQIIHEALLTSTDRYGLPATNALLQLLNLVVKAHTKAREQYERDEANKPLTIDDMEY